MNGYLSSKTDLIFENHNENLTIYCYEGSMAAKYAIKYNIKYAYLPKTTNNEPNNNQGTDQKQPQKTNVTTNTTPQTSSKDSTTAKGSLPKAGTSMVILLGIVLITFIAIIFYKKYYKYRDIK